MAKIYAYARCSLGEEYGQDLRRQTRELEAAGAEEIITEREHGDKEKACLNDLLERMEPQSTLMVCEVSRLARSTKMLCEIINIIKGDMSIVGPRPERVEHVEKYKEDIPEFKYREKVKAGLTGLAQVYGKYNTSAYDKLKLDLMYIQNYYLNHIRFSLLYQYQNHN